MEKEKHITDGLSTTREKRARLSRAVIWTIKDSELGDVHFDNRQYNFITWNNDNLSDFQTKLQNRIEATIGRGPL